MTEKEMQDIIRAQRAFYESGATRAVEDRLRMLEKLRGAMKARETELAAALKEDLGKSPEESYMCETGLAMSEISWLLKHTKRLSGEKRVTTPLAQYVSRSYRRPSPYGTVLIMSPWNYPVLLSIDPLADAVAAGNTVVVKPSAYSPATSRALTDLINDVFPKEWVCVVTGGRAENAALLDQKWDKIFFTGSQSVGRTVMRSAAEYLTPVTLELGGKSPCIVDETAKIPLAARRIVWGKYLNCGQTCVAPDYILCKEEIRERLIGALAQEIHRQFGEDPLENENYGKIINQKHYDRICGLIDAAGDRVVTGGGRDPESLRIAPAVISPASWEDAVMQEEIFGPVLPILTYRETEELPAIVNSRPRPLALYVFSENRGNIRYVTDRCQFGGGCVNDCVIHLATPYMPFGGVGESGMGCYHGEEGFYTFSHRKSIVDKKTWIDLPMRYQPFTDLYSTMVRWFVH